MPSQPFSTLVRQRVCYNMQWSHQLSTSYHFGQRWCKQAKSLTTDRQSLTKSDLQAQVAYYDFFWSNCSLLNPLSLVTHFDAIKCTLHKLIGKNQGPQSSYTKYIISCSGSSITNWISLKSLKDVVFKIRRRSNLDFPATKLITEERCGNPSATPHWNVDNRGVTVWLITVTVTGNDLEAIWSSHRWSWDLEKHESHNSDVIGMIPDEFLMSVTWIIPSRFPCCVFFLFGYET